VSGNIVVWADQREPSGECIVTDIYGYDLSTGQEFPICVETGDQSHPAISGNIVVWSDGRLDPVHCLMRTIYGYDLSTHSEFPIPTGGQGYPAIDGNIMVWADGRNSATSGSDIYGYNLSTHVEFPICTAPGNQGEPAISGNIVVWASPPHSSGPTGDIYGCDLSTGQTFPICTAQRGQWAPAVSGNIVVWEDHRNDPTWPDMNIYGEIYGYDLATHQEFHYVTGPGFNPAISGNILTWEDTRNGHLDCEGTHCSWVNRDIYARKLSTGEEFPVCTRNNEQRSPAVSGNFIVWTDETGYYEDIWGYAIEGQPPVGPLPAPANLTASVFVGPYYQRKVNLAWRDNSSDETAFQVERKQGASGTWALIYTAAPNATTYSDSNFSIGYTLPTYYRVRAYRAGVYSNYSNEASALIPIFNDVLPTASWWQYVEALWRRGVTRGCSDAPPLYCPYQNVSRAQMAVFLCKAAGKGALNRETPTFCDVPKTDPSYAWIERLADSASWGGNPPTIGCTWFPCKKFCPSSPVLRDEMAAFLVRATGKLPMPSCSGVFADVWAGGWACPYVERLTDPASWGGAAVTSGCAQGPPRFYCPKLNVTRGQMAVFLVRAFSIPL
jgi:beta propeller repeat protein